ncbi:TetR/AcrR family transcriptional regulator [Streptomyces beijiangensis]
MASSKRARIVTAALGVFGRYGYRRTSMDLIAQAAHMSRPAVYQHFKNKQAILRAVGQLITDQVTAEARTADEVDQPAAERLYRVLAVKLDLLAGTVEAAHRAELFAEAAQIAPAVIDSFEQRYRDVIETVLTDCADELDLLDLALPARDTAELLLHALAGMTQTSHGPEILHARLHQLTELTVRGLTSNTQET